MPTLHEIFTESTIEDLKYRLAIFKIKLKAPRKAECVDALMRCYNGNSLQNIWASLDPLQQNAVAEACYGSFCEFDESLFEAKYGALPAFVFHSEKMDAFEIRRNRNPETATYLNLLLFKLPRESGYFIPGDLAKRLKEFVPKPMEAAIKTIESPAPEKGLYEHLSELSALADVKSMLRLFESGAIKLSDKTGKTSVAGYKKIMDHLTEGDYFPLDVAINPKKDKYDQEVGFIKPVAWPNILNAAKFLKITGTKTQLSAAGVKALRQEPEEIIRQLWEKWLDNTFFDEFNRIEDIKGQYAKGHMTAKPPRRRIIEDALLDFPANQWISTMDFSTYMKATDRCFLVTNDPWRLYLEDPEYGNFGYSGYGDWSVVQLRYILCLLFEYAATLGLIDIAYVHPSGALPDFHKQWGADDMDWLSRYDGLRAFRITNLGAYCFGMTDTYTAPVYKSSLKLSVHPNLSISIAGGTPNAQEILTLNNFAEETDTMIWKLDAAKTLEAIERGYKVADFMAFLQSHDDQLLPETVEGFLKNSQRNGTAITDRGKAQIFECRDSKIADLICSQKELQNFCFRFGNAGIVVPEPQEDKFKRVSRLLGYGFV